MAKYDRPGFEGTIRPYQPTNYRKAASQGKGDRTATYIGMEGRVTLTELHRWLSENWPDADPDDVHLNWHTMVWERDASPEQVEQFRRWERESRERQERWEREYYEKLRTKFEQEEQG